MLYPTELQALFIACHTKLKKVKLFVNPFSRALIYKFGRGRGIYSGLLPSALRADLRSFKFAPGEFVYPLFPSINL